MELLAVRALQGANVWSRSSVLEARVAVGNHKHLAGDDILAFERRLLAWLPGWSPAGDIPVETPQARVVDALRGLALELQVRANTPGGCGAIGPLSPSDTLDIAIEYQEERLARACLESARRMCQAALASEGFDAQTEVARLRSLAEDVCLGRATGPLVAAAQAKGIPFCRLDGESLVQLGHGAQRRRIRTSTTERTGKIAEWISLDKELTKSLLAQVGIPVPVGRRVESAEQAWAVACELGTPVAIKPASADYGHGIGLHLHTREQVLAAYAVAREYREEVLVERFVRGEQYRLTVVGNRMVAGVRREPVRLTGDGQHTIEQLMEIANRNPRRGDDLRLPLTYVCPDDDTPQILAEQGFTLESVLPAGCEVVMSRIAHSWAGAGVTDVTDQVHPRVAAQCVRAVRLIGLDLAGLDIVAEDIARPLEDQGGAIIEVNAEPTIAFHFPPLCDTYRPICEAIIDSLFPDGKTGRIPVAVVSGLGERARVGRLLACLLRAPGRETGRASSDGLFLGDDPLKPGDQGNLAGSLAALLCPEFEMAVLERDLTSIREEGLGIDRVDVALLTRPSSESGTGFSAEHARAASALAGAIAPSGSVVIDAEDRAAVALTDSFTGTIILVGGDGSGVGRGHGCRAAVFLRDNDVVFLSRDRQEHRVPLGENATVDRSAAGVWLSAAAAAWAMGVPAETIAARLPALLRDL
jgi:cyanophycin synthetase